MLLFAYLGLMFWVGLLLSICLVGGLFDLFVLFTFVCFDVLLADCV